MPSEMQMFACGAYMSDDYGDCYRPPAPEIRREAPPRRLRDLLPPASDVEVTRRRVACLLGVDPGARTPPEAPPSVHPFPVNGQWPRPENVVAIRQAVDAIPAHLRSKWLAAGGRLEIVPGQDARIHPANRLFGTCAGWNASKSAFCVVAGDHQEAGLTAVHEIGHALDYLLGFPSRSQQWLQIWQTDVAAGSVPRLAGQRESAAEYFAESFARAWHPVLYAVSLEAETFIVRRVLAPL